MDIMSGSKKIKKQKPIIFIQDCGIFSNDVLVASGAGQQQILKFLKSRKHIPKEAIKWIEGETRAFKLLDENKGVSGWKDGRLLLLLRPVNDDWDYWETLLHEVHHLVSAVVRYKRMWKEIEAQAYFAEYLFRHIRRKLMGFEKL